MNISTTQVVKPNTEVEDWYFEVSRREMLPFVKADAKKILEFGCGSGCFASLVKQKTNGEVWGVELNPNAAKAAAERIDRVLNTNADDAISDLPADYFDCIVFNDILEHLAYPADTLSKCKSLLAPGGKIVASIPNIRFYPSLRHILLDRDFHYVDSGVFDRTHLRFFTRKSIARLFEESGLKIDVIEGLPLPGNIKSKGIKFVRCLSFLKFFEDMQFMQFGCIASK